MCKRIQLLLFKSIFIVHIFNAKMTDYKAESFAPIIGAIHAPTTTELLENRHIQAKFHNCFKAKSGRLIPYVSKPQKIGLFEGMAHERSVQYCPTLGLQKKSDAVIIGLELPLSHLEDSDESRYGTISNSLQEPSFSSISNPFTVAASPSKVPVEQFLHNTSVNRLCNLKLVIFVGAGILIITIISTLAVFLHRIRKCNGEDSAQKTGGFPKGGLVSHVNSAHFIPYEELKEATNNFEPDSVLGEGGFGRVFRGVLGNGTAVAIKRLVGGGQQGDREFSVEVNLLSRLHHRNLVKLIGFCTSHDESSQNLLCYELAKKGSLDSWLHGPFSMTHPLLWITRMKIALDAARGLAYLHEDTLPCVIHRDLKASNILLDDNFDAKISDFGLAKLAPNGPEDYLYTRVMGTFGYVAPEYAMTGHVLVRSDVYSYGVVLLELLTGRKPVDMSRPRGQENLVTWARPILGEESRLEELADPSMDGKYPRVDFSVVCTIAAACVAPEAEQRPAMGEVVQSLKMVQPVLQHPTNQTTFDIDDLSSASSSRNYTHQPAEKADSICRVIIFSEDLQQGR